MNLLHKLIDKIARIFKWEGVPRRTYVYRRKKEELPSLEKFQRKQLIENIAEIKEQYEKEYPTGELKSDTPNLKAYNVKGTTCFFDDEGYKFFLEEFLPRYEVSIDKDGYLIGEKGNIKAPFHRSLKREEVEEMADKLGYPIKDVHVHHRNGTRLDNRSDNLQVLHKDDHAKEHGYDTWEEFQRHRKKGLFIF